ncbi:MAG: dihydroflavonol-4-reductase [Halobacteriales archaeon]|jgi:dihydroflavonol-4-reductase
MHYFVTGGTGFIGSHLVERLVADGHRLTVLTRSRSNVADLPDAVTVVEGDITDKESMREGMDGVDGVFHLAAWFQIGPGPWNEAKAERINVDGTRNVLELMDELDVPKGVYASTVGVYGNTGGETVDESYRSPNDFPSVYQETKWRAHYEVAEPMIDDGLPLVITTLGAIYGPRDKNYGGTPRTAFVDYLHGDLPMIPSDFVFSFDYVEDTARMLHKAMAEGEPGEEYIIAKEPRNLVEVFRVAERLTGIDGPRAVPGTLLRWLSHPMAGIEKFTTSPEGLQSEILRFFDSGAVLVDNSKAQRELGIRHRPLEDGVREYLIWELEQQGMDARIEPAPTP